MNIQSLYRKIELFEELVIQSGFKRDIIGYVSSITPSQNRSNLAMFQDIAEKVKSDLIEIYSSDLPNSLEDLLPEGEFIPFTRKDHLALIDEIMQDTDLEAPDYFVKLHGFLNTLDQQIESNKNKLEELKKVFEVYVKSITEELQKSDLALVSLIFKDDKSIKNLKDFSRALNKWNRASHNFHTLVSSNPPEPIELVEIQNGSIDVLVNLDVDVTIDFVEVIKLGLEVFGGYLLYKSKAAEIVKTYFGNKKLIAQEKEREQALLDNISEAMEAKLKELHTEASKKDKKIVKAGTGVKIKDIKNVISEHIVKGNDIKLIGAPEDKEDLQEESKEVNKKSISNRRLLSNLTDEDIQKLIDQYKMDDEDESQKS